jgi:two-component system cell cycle response regulator
MSSRKEHAGRVESTEEELDWLKAEVIRNEDKMRRSQERELRLLQAEDLEALFREMLDGLRSSYQLEYVSVVICDADHEIRHLLLAAGTPVEDFENLVIVESLTGMAPQYVALSRPWLGAFAACDHQLLFPGSAGLASVALIPLMHRRRLFGSINLGSVDAGRFTRGHATDFLAHLGVIASFSIENGVNRARLLRSGFTDVLTGWHNRRYLQLRLAEELARARRDRAHLACLMLDVDHFKRINDSFGHVAGDAVLRELANRIDAEVRASDVSARYGGEEFVILLPRTEASAAVGLAERIRRAVSASPCPLPGGSTVAVTASIGIAAVQPGVKAKDLKTLGEALIARADVALYRAKSAGRNQVAVDED